MDAEEQRRRRDLFLEHVAIAFDVGLEVAAREAEAGKEPVEVAREALVTCLHNLFVILEHGTGLEFLVFLVDEDGNELTPGALHEDFIGHLLDTGRYQ